MGGRAAISFNDCCSKGWLPSPWERHIWIVKWFTLQKIRERNHSFKFSEVQALRKGRAGTRSWEESCLHFNQAQGNAKDVLNNFQLHFIISGHFSHLFLLSLFLALILSSVNQLSKMFRWTILSVLSSLQISLSSLLLQMIYIST